MKAVRLVNTAGPLRVAEVPMPPIGEEDALVQIRAAGVCHSDVHYWQGVSPVGDLPQTLGHEISGVVERLGRRVTSLEIGQRVCLHYLITCGRCRYCRSGAEQFCSDARMIGKDIDGGYAEYIAIPARNAVLLPDEIPFEQGAVLMCSSSTAFHALRKARLRAGETVAVFGAGGLGMSAIQLARVFGALTVYAVDVDEERLATAERYGAIPIDGSSTDPVRELQGRRGGVDVSLALVGLVEPMRQAVQCLAPCGRAVLVGLTNEPLCVDSYREVLGKEVEIIGCSDHVLDELPALVDLARQGRLDLSRVVTRTIPLEEDAVNDALKTLHRFGRGVRTVITP